MNGALITVLGGIIAALVAYIFATFRSDTAARMKHHEEMIAEIVKNNNQLSKIINDHEYQIKAIRNKLKMKPEP